LKRVPISYRNWLTHIGERLEWALTTNLSCEWYQASPCPLKLANTLYRSERGLFSKKAKLEFSFTKDIPENWRPKISKSIQKSYNGHAQLSKYTKVEVS
jgi:hypothetical protein